MPAIKVPHSTHTYDISGQVLRPSTGLWSDVDSFDIDIALTFQCLARSPRYVFWRSVPRDVMTLISLDAKVPL